MADAVAPLLVIMGETASGKSALALELAQKLNGEIICADSWTVYKGFDIGTAKPTLAEQKLVRHHLLDVTTAEKGFSAPQFQRLSLAAIDDISRRGKLPIMVGGTGLYIDSVLFSYSFLPPSSDSLRSKLNGLSLPELEALARKANLPLDAIDAKNKRRVIRLIENGGKMPSRSGFRPNTMVLVMSLDSEVLMERIKKRIDGMVAAGFADEVRELGRRHGWACEPMKAPGYRAFADFVQGLISLEKAKQRFRQNDLKLAKKQRTWLRRPIYSNNAGPNSCQKSIQKISNRDKLDHIVDLATTNLSINS